MDTTAPVYRASFRLRALFALLCVLCLPAGVALAYQASAAASAGAILLSVTLLLLGCFGAHGSVAVAGRIFLEEDGLRAVRFGREVFLPFAEVKEVRCEAIRGRWRVLANDVTLYIDDQLVGYLDLVQHLRARVSIDAAQDDSPLPLRFHSLLGLVALFLLPVLLLSLSAVDASRLGVRDVSYALWLLALLWLLLLGFLVPLRFDFLPAELRLHCLLWRRSLPYHQLVSAELGTQEFHGVQTTALLLRFSTRRRPVVISQAALSFPLLLLLDKINEAASLRQAARTEGELYKGENRRKNRRALS